MAITISEKWESRESLAGEFPYIMLTYLIEGTDDDQAAKTMLRASTPTTYDGLKRKSWSVERIAQEKWLGKVRYAQRGTQETGDWSFSFETGGGTQHITQSMQTVNTYAPSGQTAPDFGGAIGVTDSGVEGVDITVPVFNFTETHYLADALAGSVAYQDTIFRLTGTVNNAMFRSFYPGEVLFLGAAGTQRSADDWEVTFKFAAQWNRTNLSVGDIIGIAKLGWEYLWVRYEEAEDATAQALIKKPVAVYIEQVYEYGDYSGLQI